MWRLWSAIIRKKEGVTPRPRRPSSRWSPRTCSPRWSSGGRRQRWTTTLIIFQLINISPPHVSCLLIYFINLTNCNKHSLPRLHFIKYKVVPHQNRPLGHRVVPSPGYVRGSGGEYSQHHPVDPHHLHARAVPGRVLPLPAIQSPDGGAHTCLSQSDPS